ncbi:hypothetical protein [Haloferula sp. A504]|uniref:hypothetical protein n=1 Tax=Haloferula sp. A504 TaxID=3373601 RepID=UPI0031BE704C|nr:hypothetical protein [Verrucomicrobiaceae bacterium E54]
MPRLVRIALTLFLSATVLVLLVAQRLGRLKQDLQYASEEVAEELMKTEGEMILIGQLIAGGLAAAGFVLILIAIFRAKRQAPGNDG